MKKNYKKLDITKKYLITGGAGFIGFHLSRQLLKKGCSVIGLDNLNDYYEVQLKLDRLELLESYENYRFIKGDLADRSGLEHIFEEERPDPL